MQPRQLMLIKQHRLITDQTDLNYHLEGADSLWLGNHHRHQHHNCHHDHDHDHYNHQEGADSLWLDDQRFAEYAAQLERHDWEDEVFFILFIYLYLYLHLYLCMYGMCICV